MNKKSLIKTFLTGAAIILPFGFLVIGGYYGYNHYKNKKEEKEKEEEEEEKKEEKNAL